MDCPLFWEAVKNQNLPKHKRAVAAVQNTGKRQVVTDLQNKDAMSSELSPTKSVNAMIEEKDIERTAIKDLPEINYQKATAQAIIKVKQDVATKEIKQKLKQEL